MKVNSIFNLCKSLLSCLDLPLTQFLFVLVQWVLKRTARVLFIVLGLSKYFTYVTKTRANLTTYSRKPENYNGTNIFEIDIMKNSSPINLYLCQSWLFHKYFGRFFYFDLLCHTYSRVWNRRRAGNNGRAWKICQKE